MKLTYFALVPIAANVCNKNEVAARTTNERALAMNENTLLDWRCSQSGGQNVSAVPFRPGGTGGEGVFFTRTVFAVVRRSIYEHERCSPFTTNHI
ncbi:MAG: hypothetical protein KKG06_01575 [Bacteroidetes bacterium]|nr:hypothetical protein [Bacteroidota bacterium]MBU1421869.1 hypothetical protein [Bacteroidota bacterium]